MMSNFPFGFIVILLFGGVLVILPPKIERMVNNRIDYNQNGLKYGSDMVVSGITY